MKDEDIEIVVGRTEGGSFVQVKHIPSGRQRYKGPLDGDSPDAVQARLVKELLIELRDAQVDGFVEVEPDCFVSVQIPSRMTATQLSAIRQAHAPFQAMSVSELRRLLVTSSDILLGPYLWPHVAEERCRQLRDAALVAVVVIRPPT